MADPGFPVGGGGRRRPPMWALFDFLAKTYAKMKELDPVGGGGGGAPAEPPGSANG